LFCSFSENVCYKNLYFVGHSRPYCTCNYKINIKEIYIEYTNEKLAAFNHDFFCIHFLALKKNLNVEFDIWTREITLIMYDHKETF